MIDVRVSAQPPVEVFDQMKYVRRVHAFPVVVVLLLAGLVALQLWARSTDYGLRVTSDTPTFLALIPDMADRPFERQSPFLSDNEIATPHAEPYTQALAFLWKATRASGEERDPVALGRMLSLVGIGVMFFVLFAVFAYARSVVGRREAWIAVPALLALFGPANVIWASDLSLHGFLYASWFPQNVAIGLLLFTLLAARLAEARCRAAVDPADRCDDDDPSLHGSAAHAPRRSSRLPARPPARRSLARAVVRARGRLRARLALARVLAEPRDGGDRPARRPLRRRRRCDTAPRTALAGSRPVRRSLALWETVVRHLASQTRAHWLAVGGFVIVLALGLWAAALAHLPPSDPLITTNRLSIYWVEDRWRWPLMLAAGAIGIYGLARLAQRGRTVPALWFAGCFTLGTIGALGSLAGIQIPIWYRFLLAAQIPLAIGVAAAMTGLPRHTTRYVATAAGFAIALQDAHARRPSPDAHVLPHGHPGCVQARRGDPARRDGAGRHRPAHRVLHPRRDRPPRADGDEGARRLSRRSSATAERGYAVLHEFWSGGPTWWQAAQRMWVKGVRWIVVEKSTLLAAPTLEKFSTGPSPLVHPGRGARAAR